MLSFRNRYNQKFKLKFKKANRVTRSRQKIYNVEYLAVQTIKLKSYRLKSEKKSFLTVKHRAYNIKCIRLFGQPIVCATI